MDTYELFCCSRSGDLQKLRYLVEQKEVDLNQRDKWDSTPLYYACLCGHEDVVIYLLENGGRCEANTFDGERCLYGALNNKIRNVLKRNSAITSRVMRRDIYFEFLQKLLESGSFPDFTFNVYDRSFAVHRCILSARCPYFAEMFLNKWKNKNKISISHSPVSAEGFKSVLQFLYTARLECHVDHLDNVMKVAMQCGLDKLRVDLMEKSKKDLESRKPGYNVTLVCLELPEDVKKLKCDLRKLADETLPFSDKIMQQMPFSTHLSNLYADVIFEVEGLHFQCHQEFFVGRSDYFKALFKDHFAEARQDSSSLPIITLKSLSIPVWTPILFYIYSDTCKLDCENVFAVLVAADLYFLPGLKRLCANFLTRFIDCENVIKMIRSSRSFNLPRLEDACASFIAANIEKMIGQEDFIALIQADAEGVGKREETDSIPIIDDIRFHMTNCLETMSDMYENEQHLHVIDNLLLSLGLEC